MHQSSILRVSPCNPKASNTRKSIMETAQMIESRYCHKAIKSQSTIARPWSK